MMPQYLLRVKCWTCAPERRGLPRSYTSVMRRNRQPKHRTVLQALCLAALFVVSAAPPVAMALPRGGALVAARVAGPDKTIGTVDGTSVRLLSRSETAAAMAAKDPFLTSLTSVDRQIILHSESVPDPSSFPEKFAALARDWSTSEADQLKVTVSRADALIKASGMSLLLPKSVSIARQESNVYDGAPYTRGTTVFLTGPLSSGDRGALTLIHELVHIADRSDAQLRRRLYELVGFTPCRVPISSLGVELASKIIHNPDGPGLGEWCVDVPFGAKGKQRYTEVLVAGAPYNPKQPFFAIVKPVLVQLDASGKPALGKDGKVVTRDLDSQFFQATGGNAQGEPLDPAEFVAVNVAAAVHGAKSSEPNKALLASFRSALKRT